jgi:hypothetical protein
LAVDGKTVRAGTLALAAWALALSAALTPVACGSGPGPCDDDYDCDGVQVCRKSTGECEAVVCTADPDCVSRDLACIDNACVPRACETDGDCGKAGYACVEHACAVAPVK